MTKRKEDLILRAINYDPFGDTDGDSVQNIIDCSPNNPLKDGFFRDFGGALKRRLKPNMLDYKQKTRDGILEDALKPKTDPSILNYKPRKSHKLTGEISEAIKTRVKGGLGETKERLVKGIAGEEAREERKELRETEHKSYFKEAKEMAQERGKEKAQRKFTKHKIGEGFGKKVEDLEEKVDKFAKKAGKHGKGMLDGFDDNDIDEKKLLHGKKGGRYGEYRDKKTKKVGRLGRDIKDHIGKETKPRKSVKMVAPLTISVPKKPVPSAKSQKSVMVPLAVSNKKPIVAPLIISLPKRRGKMLLDVGL